MRLPLAATAARRRIVHLLQGLRLADPVLSARNGLRRCWHTVADRVRCALLTRRAGLPLEAGFVAVTRVRRDGSRRAVLARVRRDHRASAAAARNRDLARSVLHGLGVPFCEVGGDLVVSVTDASWVCGAVRESGPLIYVEPAPTNDTDDETTPRRSTELLVFEHSVADSRTAMYEADVACRVRFEEEPGHEDTAVTFPIDVVYTWVDGNDPSWRSRRAAALGVDAVRHSHPEAASRARYDSFDELRYSLRSVERFAEFVRHVFIVTDDQCPEWLDTSHPQVSVVDHRSIFPDESYLPVFNSHAIEARLHHIPGLADHYLYLNDDFMFGRHVTARDFFDPDGTAKVFTSRSSPPVGVPIAELRPVDAAAVNVLSLVEREFGGTVTRNKFKHAPYAQRKAVYDVIESRFGAELERTARSRVRGPDDIAAASSLHHHVALVTGLGRVATIDSGYVDLGQVHLRTRLEQLRRTPLPQAICLNDSDRNEVPRYKIVKWTREFFEAVYPDKSSYER